MTARATEVAAVSALALVVTLAIAAPVLRAPSDRLFGMEIVGRHSDPFTAMEQFGRPIGDLARGRYAQPLTDMPGALLRRASGPVAAYNWLVLVTFPLSAAAAYLLARHLTLSMASATLAALAFAFSPFHLAHAAYHPHIAQTQWIPLYFLALWRCLDDGSAAAVILLVVAIVGVTLSNFYGGLIAAVITPFAIATYWFFKSRREPSAGRRLVITLISLAVVAGGTVACAWDAAHAAVVNRESLAFARGDLFRYSAKWWSYLVPPVEHPLLGGIAERVWDAAGVHAGLLEQQVSLGWGVAALGVVAVFAWLKGHRHPTSLALVPVLAIVAFVALVCSLSPERIIGPLTFVRPSALLYRVLPMFRSYARFGVVVQLMAALLAAIGAERLWRAGALRARIACVALLVFAGGEYLVWPPALWRDVLPTQAHRWAVQQADRVNVLDCAPLTPESASIQWLTGYRVSLGRAPFDDCTEPNLADKLSATGYTHLLVRRSVSEMRWFATERTPGGLQLAARFPDSVVFAVTAPPPIVYTAQMTAFSWREHDDTWTWRWMEGEASWKIVNRGNRPVVAAVDIDMTTFRGPRRLKVLLDATEVQSLVIEAPHRVNRIGPLALTPGDHQLVFRSIDPPALTGDLVNNGDRRRLSFAVGAWNWVVEPEHR
jgi:hypothetical protein